MRILLKGLKILLNRVKVEGITPVPLSGLNVAFTLSTLPICARSPEGLLGMMLGTSMLTVIRTV